MPEGATGENTPQKSPPLKSPPLESPPLLHTQFATLLAYRVLSILSYQITSVTVGWHVYELTRNPLSLGLIGLAEVIPYFCFALFAGYAVDHLPRRKLGLAACVCLSITGLLLTAISAGWLPNQNVWMIYAAIAVTGVARAFLARSTTHCSLACCPASNSLALPASAVWLFRRRWLPARP